MTPWMGDQFQDNLGSHKLKIAGSHVGRNLGHKVTGGGEPPRSRNTWIERRQTVPTESPWIVKTVPFWYWNPGLLVNTFVETLQCSALAHLDRTNINGVGRGAGSLQGREIPVTSVGRIRLPAAEGNLKSGPGVLCGSTPHHCVWPARGQRTGNGMASCSAKSGLGELTFCNHLFPLYFC